MNQEGVKISYVIFRRDRSSNIQARLRVGGGIAIYIREDLDGKRMPDLESHRIEQLYLNFTPKLNNIDAPPHSYLICIVPRKPLIFFEYIIQLVERIFAEVKETNFIRDFNIDIYYDE